MMSTIVDLIIIKRKQNLRNKIAWGLRTQKASVYKQLLGKSIDIRILLYRMVETNLYGVESLKTRNILLQLILKYNK